MKYIVLLNILLAFVLSVCEAQTKCATAGEGTADRRLRALLKQKCETFMAVQAGAVRRLNQVKKGPLGAVTVPKGRKPKPPYPDVAQRLRKDIRMMTDQERNRFFTAVQRLKKSGVYDRLVRYHLPSEGTFAHYGAAFLPWHREYLHRYEEELRKIDRSVTIPYWDSTLDQALPDPKDSIMWTDKFVGGGNGEVKDGPFANWESPRVYFANLNLPPSANFLKTSKFMRRNVGQSPSLASRADFQSLFQGNSYENLIWIQGARKFEDLHGIPHIFVGGHMAEIISASVDPVFWMHHAFIDCIWEEYRQTRQSSNNVETQYTTNPVILGGDGHKGNASLLPWKELTPIHGLSNYYSNGFYRCAPRPTCNGNGRTCGPYLFCDTPRRRCVSQIKAGGNCRGFNGVANACQRGHECSNGRCVIGTTRCRSDNDCTTGTVCCNQKCTTTCIVQPGARCSPLKKCSAGYICCRGRCTRNCAVSPGGACTAQNKCVAGYVCCRGKCSRSCAVSPGGSCNAQSRCTSGHVCCRGRCSRSCAVSPGGSCNAQNRCTSGYVCCRGSCSRSCNTPSEPECNAYRRCRYGFKCCRGSCRRRCQSTPEIKCNWWNNRCPRGMECCDDNTCKRSCYGGPRWF